MLSTLIVVRIQRAVGKQAETIAVHAEGKKQGVAFEGVWIFSDD